MISVYSMLISLPYLLLLLLAISLFYFIPVKAANIKDINFNFVAAGDWGCGHEAINTLSMMENMDPELYLGLGDYSYQNSPDCWINIIKSVDNLFRIAVGNHDAQDQLLKDYMNKFKLDEQYYSFNYLNAHFIALSTELDK